MDGTARAAADPLADAFQHDLRCRSRDAARLAARARRAHIGGAEDSVEDLVVRLQDPRTFGDFAANAVRDRRLADTTRLRLAERAFDLLPLPDTEAEVLVVEGRAPPSLLRLIEFLGSRRALTPLHVLHLVYAVFLDRSLVAAVPPRVRARALLRVAGAAQGAEKAVLLYAAMHLAAVSPVEGAATLRHILNSRGVPEGVKRSLSDLAASSDGGMAAWTRLAQAEALLAGDVAPESPAGIANAPRLPERVQAIARRWLAR